MKAVPKVNKEKMRDSVHNLRKGALGIKSNSTGDTKDKIMEILKVMVQRMQQN